MSKLNAWLRMRRLTAWQGRTSVNDKILPPELRGVLSYEEMFTIALGLICAKLGVTAKEVEQEIRRRVTERSQGS